MLKSPIPQLNAYCILVTVLFHLFVYLFLIILMKFIFSKMVTSEMIADQNTIFNPQKEQICKALWLILGLIKY